MEERTAVFCLFVQHPIHVVLRRNLRRHRQPGGAAGAIVWRKGAVAAKASLFQDSALYSTI